MADQQDYEVNSEEGEYQFSDSDTSQVYDVKKEKLSFLKKIKRKQIVMGVVFLLLVYGAYKIISPSQNQKFAETNKAFAQLKKSEKMTPVKPFKKKVVKQVAKKPATLKPATWAAATKLEKKVVAKKVANDDLVKAVTAIAKRDSAILGQLKTSYDGRISALQTKNKSLNDSVENLANRIAQLTGVVEKMQSGMAKQEKKVKSEAKEIAKATGNEPPMYHVQAVIPQRAWLSDGKTTTTVSVGTAIKDYGKVIKINPYLGTVTTSTGKVFKYGIAAS